MSHAVPFYWRGGSSLHACVPEQREAVRRSVWSCSLLIDMWLPDLCVYVPAGTSLILQLMHTEVNK